MSNTLLSRWAWADGRPDPSKLATDMSKADIAALPDLNVCLEALAEAQRKLHANGQHAVLLILQGLDASGKDSLLRTLAQGLDPAGFRVYSFGRPSPEELKHDFLWRVHPHAPARGEVAIFNRSHYEDVLIARVHQLCPKSQINQRYEQIKQFESLLRIQANTQVIKFFLHVSREEQLARFAQRLDDPARNWKIALKASMKGKQHD